MASTIFTAQTPVTTDFDGANHGWGMQFAVSSDCTCTGGRAWVPASGRPGTFFWQLWHVGSSTKLAEVNLNSLAAPSSNTWMSFASSDFASPGDVALDDAESYICNVYFVGDGVFTDPGSFPVGSGGLVSSSAGRFNNGAGQNAMPGSSSATYFFADVNAEISFTTHDGAGTTAATGTASATSTVDRVAAGSAAGTGTSSTTATVTREGAATAAGTGVATSSATVDRDAAATAPATGASASTATVTRQASGSTAATGGASATATVDPGGIPVPPIVWRAGPPQAKWSAGPPESKWSTGGTLPVEVFRATSTETVRSGRISATAAGAAVDPTGFTVTVAFAPTDTAPAAASSSWKTATWDTDTTTTPTTYRAQAAIGPSGVQELAPGVWWMFAKVTASGETPIIPSGPFKVVP